MCTWIERYTDFPIISRGGNSSAPWQFDLEAVRDFVATRRTEQNRTLVGRRAAIRAARNRGV